MAQFAVPDADQATGSWTTTPLWSKVDEGSPGDGTNIALASGNPNNNADLRLSDVTDPESSTGHILRVEWNKASGSRTLNAFIELWEGVPGTGTMRAQGSQTDPTGAEYTYTLSAGEADAITDYTNLYLRIYYTYTGGGGPSSITVDFAELETPNASTNRRAQISWAELEVPTAPRKAEVSWVELEIPNAPRGAEVSWIEFEIPNADRGAEVSWVEFEIPTAPRSAEVSWIEFEIPNAPRRAEISWIEFEVPSGGAPAEGLPDDLLLRRH